MARPMPPAFAFGAVLEIAMLVTFICHRSFLGVALCATYYLFSLSRLLIRRGVTYEPD
jgi:hypothetical protein